jgi:rubrerythrin
MEKYSINEVIEQAIQTESLGYQFYSVMADRFKKDEVLRQLFENLGEKERIHEERFRKIKEAKGLTEPEGWEEASQYLRAIVESEFFLGKYKSLPELENVNSIEASVNFAIGFEKETLLYFHGLRDMVKEKDVVDAIISEEKNHLLWLTAFRRDLKKQI